MITCKEYAKDVKEYLRDSISFSGKTPTLTIIQVGDNQASNAYVGGKIRDCQEVGINSRLIKLSESISQVDFVKTVKNEVDSGLSDGIIIQLPLPKHLNEKKAMYHIPPYMDVDGFRSDSCFTPCTPLGIMRYLKENRIEIEGKHCVIIGRSDIVGKPMAKLMLEENATTTVCHSKTKNLSDITRTADIIIVAVGVRDILTGDMVKEGAVVVDVGINRNEEGKLCGDCHYPSLVDKCSLITPVPSGVGLITRATLLQNVYDARTK